MNRIVQCPIPLILLSCQKESRRMLLEDPGPVTPAKVLREASVSPTLLGDGYEKRSRSDEECG